MAEAMRELAVRKANVKNCDERIDSVLKMRKR
jgi:hypothetical protein